MNRTNDQRGKKRVTYIRMNKQTNRTNDQTGKKGRTYMQTND